MLADTIKTEDFRLKIHYILSHDTHDVIPYEKSLLNSYF
jgi:hypothetical protein